METVKSVRTEFSGLLMEKVERLGHVISARSVQLEDHAISVQNLSVENAETVAYVVPQDAIQLLAGKENPAQRLALYAAQVARVINSNPEVVIQHVNQVPVQL